MSRWTPCKRGEFIRRLRKLGLDGPFSGTHHQFMILAERRLAIPSNAEYSVPQLRMMIREVEAILRREIASDEWERLVAGTWISLGLWDGLRIRQRPKWGKMLHSWHFFDLRP